LTASPSFNSTAASDSSVLSGVYGVTNADGETVVGWEIPESCELNETDEVTQRYRTLNDLLSAVDL
jgi:hypothetical protein